MRALLVAAVLSACATDAIVEESSTRCTAIEGKAFTTVDPQVDCGLPAPGSPPSQCHWSIMVKTATTDTSRFQWQWSDVEESLDVKCHGASITTADGNY